MPNAAPRFCSEPRCPEMASYKGRCRAHARVQERSRYNTDTRKWYYTEAWKVLRQIVLNEQPICVECNLMASTEVDHKVPHRGNAILFWDRDNLQGMCATCHSRKTQRGE